MMTSAFALSQILSLASRQRDDQRFLTAVASCLGVDGPEAEVNVLQHLVRITTQIDIDIEALNLDDKTEATLKREAAPFNGIRNLSQIHQTVKHAKANILKPDHLVGLTRLHAAFAHARPAPEISGDARDLASEFKDSLEKLLASSIPSELKADIERHIRQIIATLENYYFFSEKQLDYSLAGLVGTLVLNVDETEKHAATIQPLQKVVVKLIGTIAAAGKYVGITRRLAEDGKVLLDMLRSSGN